MSRRVPTLFLILGLFSLGCGTEEEKSVSPSSVASFQGGEISFAEAEAFLRREETSEPLGSELMGEYRRAAESLAVHRILLEEARDRSDDPTALEDLRRQVTLDFYFRRVLQVAPVEEAEVEAFFKEKQALFQQPEERFVWHLFRRHRDPTQPEVTLEEVEALRQRWLAGETFLHLARQYSESETRVFEGRLGRIQRGRLPPRLDEIVFALGENEISDPVKVP
ncbi:MAG: peptidylprolyl isomerase, partial [Acidobacteriota bacterium]